MTDAAAPRPATRVPTRTLARDFKRGLSFVGLARKYGMTRHEVEDRLRQWMRRYPGWAR